MKPRPARGRGQALVEFALVLPVLLLAVLVALDFGRAFSGWVVLQNAARLGANYAGLHASGFRDGDASVIADYDGLIQRDLTAASCQSPGTPASPVFTDGSDAFVAGGNADTAYDVGDTVRVELTCDFHPLTPIVSAITGSSVRLGASSEFLIRAGGVTGLPNPTEIPAPGAPTPTPTPGPTPTACPNPLANFSGSPTSGSGGSLSVTFIDQSTSWPGCSITSWSWAFGDGQTSTQQNPIHLYTKTNPGAKQQFDVSLTVRLTSGQSNTFIASKYITVNR